MTIFANLKRTQIPILRAMFDAAGKELEEIEHQSGLGCQRCQRFTPGKGLCSVHKAVVPAEFQPHGCDDWTYDDIPF